MTNAGPTSTRSTDEIIVWELIFSLFKMGNMVSWGNNLKDTAVTIKSRNASHPNLEIFC